HHQTPQKALVSTRAFFFAAFSPDHFRGTASLAGAAIAQRVRRRCAGRPSACDIHRSRRTLRYPACASSVRVMRERNIAGNT
ncbi:hypothetical protein, partial [Burkholderia thailandensis]|uniref:hypothetical protein n=1 Tax=Burkholderia thailandensis TaxID=57975 RepID=UPI001CA510C6